MRTRSVALGPLVCLVVAGCYAAREPAPELLSCGESPYVGERFLWRGEDPPRGRIWACEACERSEEVILARSVALDCPLAPAHAACTLTGACDYRETVAWWATIDAAASCAELALVRETDGCTRPDPRIYWRPEGD